jgi:hypothetical protein
MNAATISKAGHRKVSCMTDYVLALRLDLIEIVGCLYFPIVSVSPASRLDGYKVF